MKTPVPALLLLSLGLGASPAPAQDLKTFQSGSQARAADVNSNFQLLRSSTQNAQDTANQLLQRFDAQQPTFDLLRVDAGTLNVDAVLQANNAAGGSVLTSIPSGETGFTLTDPGGTPHYIFAYDSDDSLRIAAAAGCNIYGERLQVRVRGPNGNGDLAIARPGTDLLMELEAPSGDVGFLIESDPNNSDEDDNPFLQFQQDGRRTVAELSLNNENDFVVQGYGPGIDIVFVPTGRTRVAGDLSVSGNISKGGGSFKIDHPLDPENQFLYHSFVESPDMMNIYNGNVVTDGQGFATVELPGWFDALNRDFRYQLTPIGQFAQAIVAEEIAGNRFTVQTDRPFVKVSWQVTGVRHDPYAEAHRIPLEVDKGADERGRYLHPAAYGLPESRGIDSSAKKERHRVPPQGGRSR